MNARPTNDVLVERLASMQGEMERRFSDVTAHVSRVETGINGRLDRIDVDLRGDYVRRDEFTPIKNIVFGFVAVVLLGFAGMMLYLIGWSK